MNKLLFLLLIPTLIFSQSRKLVIYEKINIDANNVLVEQVEVDQEFENFIIKSKSDPRMYTFDTFGLQKFTSGGTEYRLIQCYEFVMTRGEVRDGRRVFLLKIKFNGGEHNYEIFENR